MQLNLVPHPATPPSDPTFKLWANVDHAGCARAPIATTNIWFGIGAPADAVRHPGGRTSRRAPTNLWQTTCFEAFLRAPGGEAYREWNFAPSGDWAAYDFTVVPRRA